MCKNRKAHVLHNGLVLQVDKSHLREHVLHLRVITSSIGTVILVSGLV